MSWFETLRDIVPFILIWQLIKIEQTLNGIEKKLSAFPEPNLRTIEQTLERIESHVAPSPPPDDFD